MAVNFLHHLFKTKIESSVVCSDGYSPQNLASESWRERIRGFLAAHFVKPPVQLLFQLPFPINVQSLIIKPKVGSQISSGIDVFVAGIKHDCLGTITAKQGRTSRHKTKTSSACNTFVKGSRPRTKRQRVEINVTPTDGKNQKLLPQKEEDESTDSDSFCHKYSTLITSDSFKVEHRNLFTLVSRMNDASGRTIRVINRRYGGKLNQDICTSEETVIYEFFQSHIMNYVTHIVICINKMKGSCVPALGKVDIWGQAASPCGEYIIRFISDIQNKISHKENEGCNPKVPIDDTKRVSLDQEDNRHIHNEDESIPSDFIDPITCSLMTIPMLLPSGLNIDLTTLEKHIEAEKTWGRLPSDPFTGVVFSDDVKPLTNATLKARIDKYILTSGVDVRSHGRTVGRPQNTCLPKMPNSQHMFATVKDVVNSNSLRNCTKVECLAEKDCIAKHGHEIIGCYNQKTREKVSNVQSHEEKVSQSLDSALMETLQGVSFIRRGQDFAATNVQPVPCASSLVGNQEQQTFGNLHKKTALEENHNGQSSSDCMECKISINAAVMFQLPCKHLMCRTCLIGHTKTYKTLECSLCSCVFSHKDAVRVHY